MENSSSEKKNECIESKSKRFLNKEAAFLGILLDLNKAIRHFIRTYESLHSITILDYELQREPATNFRTTAGILRLNFTFQISEEHFESSMIIKVPQLGDLWGHAEDLLLYAKEKFMYETVFPLMYESCAQKKAVPNLYAATDLGVLVLDNLKEFRFYQKGSGSLVDVSACVTVLESLAQFHALSLRHLADIQPDLIRLSKIFERGSNDLGFYTTIIDKLKKYVLPFSPNRTRETFDVYFARLQKGGVMDLANHENMFNVLLHGDLHYFNVLFKGNNRENVMECKFVDFQMSRVGCPIVDIMVFLVTSFSPKDYGLHHRLLFHSYLSSFQSKLDEVDPGSTCPYTMDQLTDDFEKYKLFFMYQLTCFVPLFWMGQFDLAVIGDNDDIDRVLMSAKYRSFFIGWVEHFSPKERVRTESMVGDANCSVKNGAA